MAVLVKDKRYKIWYQILIWIALVTSVLVLFYFSSRLINTLFSDPRIFAGDDFLQFWSAGYLNRMGINPYDHDEIINMRLLAGQQDFTPGVFYIMWYPPWLLSILMPFSLFDYPLSRLLWLLLNTSLITICADIIWRLCQGPPRLRWLTWVIAFTMMPTYVVLVIGQITPLILLGIAGFLKYVEAPRESWVNDLAAGAFLAMATIKPHFIYLYFIAVFLWIITTRRWAVLLGTALGITVALLISIIFNPLIIKHFLAAVTNYSPSAWATPTLGFLLRSIIGGNNFFLQFVPPVFGSLWLYYYWRRNRNGWDWLEVTPVILLVSFVTAPYIWTWDQVVLLIAIISAYTGIMKYGWNVHLLLLILSYAGINVLLWYLHGFLDDGWFVWLAPAFLLWYLASQAARNKLESALKLAKDNGAIA